MSTPPTKRRKLSAGFEHWRVEDVVEHLTAEGFDEAKLFEELQLAGNILDKLTAELLQKLGVSQEGSLVLIKEFQFLKSQRDIAINSLKVFNDPIHGQIELHPLCVKIMDTTQFQRLRHIKQLGCCYLVFPGAAHNRFEHSLGVCYLAGKLCRMLQKRQPELSITEEDVLCVEIAGLCHDLGHGPYSHLFDQQFIPLVIPGSDWSHEKASVDMFDHLIKSNQLEESFSKYGLKNQDIAFIEEQIAGPMQQNNESNNWPYKGRPKEKSFLYEIVANKRNGIDVDKWDYFLRDCHNLGISCSFDCHRFMNFARVVKVDKEKQICTRDKEQLNVYDMFYTRLSLHRKAYQHKVNKIIEHMMVEALVLANDHLTIAGENGTRRKMSEAIDDMVAYTELTDNISIQIRHSEHPDLAKSREILEMIQKRRLYTYIGQAQVKDDSIITRDKEPQMKEKIKEDIIKGADSHGEGSQPLAVDQLILHIVNLNYGMGEKNPIENLRFYSKENPEEAFELPKEQVSKMLPDRFSEQFIRLYCKSFDDHVRESVFKGFNRWCETNNYVLKPETVTDPIPFTPAKQPSSAKTECGPSAPKKSKKEVTVVEVNSSAKRVIDY